MSEVILIILALLLLYYLKFLFSIYSGLGKLETYSNKLPGEYVSIIIPFRNEAENILNNLNSIQVQDYPKDKYEVIYVNDSSTDNSFCILNDNIANENIRVLDLPQSDELNAHKKRAVNYGIQNARGEIIVTTDADCIYSNKWLREMMNCYDSDTVMIAGPVQFNNDSTLFSKLQKIEFEGLIIAGAGLIGAGTPVICNAANLSYRKKIFLELNGFSDNLHLSSGDDEMLMQKISYCTDYKIKFCTSKDASVKTKPNKTLREFFQQRKRWASKGLYYKNKKIVFKLVLIFLFYAGLIIQAALSLFSPLYLITFFISFFTKLFVEYIILRRGGRLLFNGVNLKYFIPAELIHIPYIIIMSVAGAFGGFKWKDRKVKL